MKININTFYSLTENFLKQDGKVQTPVHNIFIFMSCIKKKINIFVESDVLNNRRTSLNKHIFASRNKTSNIVLDTVMQIE